MKMQSFIPIMTLSIILSAYSFAQNKWEYPVKPGTTEWREMTLQEKRNAQQIPEDILPAIIQRAKEFLQN